VACFSSMPLLLTAQDENCGVSSSFGFPHRVSTTGIGAEFIRTADFNGDNELEIATCNSLDSTISILKSIGNGNFVEAQIIEVGMEPLNFVATDINGDGHTDIASANFSSEDVSLVIGNGDGTFQTQTLLPIGEKSQE